MNTLNTLILRSKNSFFLSVNTFRQIMTNMIEYNLIRQSTNVKLN